MKNKKLKIILLLCLMITLISGCNSNKNNNYNTINKNEQAYEKIQDSKMNSKYENINSFINDLLDEKELNNKLEFANLGDYDDFNTVAYLDRTTDTIFTFYFYKDESFYFLSIIYDSTNSSSLEIVRNVLGYSKFGFTPSEIIAVQKIMKINESTEDTEIGNYYVKNMIKGTLSILPKDNKEKTAHNESQQTSTNTNANSKPNSNTNTNTNTNTNSHPSSNTSTNINTNTGSNPSSDNNSQSNSNENNSQPPSQNNSVSTSKQQALRKAKDYLNVMAFSHDGLVNQLKYEKFSDEDAKYGADNCGADWNAQALKKAKDYLNVMAFSHDGLKKQLEYDKFTSSQAAYGADNCGADWNAQAVKKAKDYLNIMAFSHDGLVSQLKYDGFTQAQAEYGVSQNGL